MSRAHPRYENNEFVRKLDALHGAQAKMQSKGSLGMSTSTSVSFEFFPPANAAAAQSLDTAIEQLSHLRPEFVSVTCGAGGSVLSRTRDSVWRLQHSSDFTVAPHLTCIDSTPAEIETTARVYWEHGIRHIVALRGDLTQPPQSATLVESAGDKYQYASQLVQALRRIHKFEISVAAYPEGHPESGLSVDADVQNLARKIDAGATRAITQFFFDNDAFLRYRDRLAACRISIPLVPGILPILGISQLSGFAQRCGATVPASLRKSFEGLEHDPVARRAVAAEILVGQVQRLRGYGVESFHFYTLNRAELTLAACEALDIQQGTRSVKVA
jgi:methylenetetrahydrofolate reductase (NADPH)